MNYRLVIQFPIADTSADYFDRLITIENELGFILRDKHIVVGHDLGTEDINLIIHTDDPDEAFELAKSALSEKDLETILVAFREINGKEYSVLWPENFSGEFRIDK